MGEKIVVGPVNKGLKTDRTAFNIDNDSFPVLTNAYQWRGRVKRKRGTSFLNRLTRFFNSTNVSYSSTATINLVAGAANILTGFGLQANGNIIPGSVTITDVTSGNVYTDPGKMGVLVGAPAGSGTINYATGAITIAGGAADTISVKFLYYPDLPVMGIRDFILNSTQFPQTLAFDTKYAYDVQIFSPYGVYDVSFYKNPPVDSTNLPGYVPKTNITPTSWNGQNYQQFWTVNYQGALWATNGVTAPFTTTNIGMQFKNIVTTTVIAGGPPATVNLNIVSHGLVVGDFVYVNEVAMTTGINFQTGYVITVTDANNVIVEFPFATIATNGTGGIAQYLTNRSDPTKDGIRWYDGDPTSGSATNPILNGNLGWVNFAPPLSQRPFSIADLPPMIYYLVGAKMIIPFKDRLLFYAPVVQASTGNPIFLPDTIVYSWNGTPYYTASYTNKPTATVDNPTFINNVLHPILVPVNQTASPAAYFEDSTGFGGFIQAGISQTLNTVSPNEDVLISGFDNIQTKVIYSGNDVVPFNFYIINAEYGSGSTFSTINMDKGVVTIGKKGLVITSQVECGRLDLEIPDQIFQISIINNGPERVTAIRDYINEWIYFTYVSGEVNDPAVYVFPNQTLQYNYRDNSWAIFDESYTTYGTFRKQTGDTWANIGLQYATWSVWNTPWEDGNSSNLLQPIIMGGNQQGFLILRDEGTNESQSLYIQNILNGTVTSPDHGLDEGDYIMISGIIGTEGNVVNGQIFSVANPITQNTFVLNPLPSDSGLTYIGGGVITRYYVPKIQTKQFPPSWGNARKTRLGPQQYLFTRTNDSEVQLQIYLSQDSSNPYNEGPIFPDADVENSALIYTTVLYTCPESTNLGLTPANTSLQMISTIDASGNASSTQAQIWHRVNTSLIGDSIQLGITMSDAQMRSQTPRGDSIPITGASQAALAVILATNSFTAGQVVEINGVKGMTELNFDPKKRNYYTVVSATGSNVTLGVNSTNFDPYMSSGTITLVMPIDQVAEIEMHGFILDVNPSMLLA